MTQPTRRKRRRSRPSPTKAAATLTWRALVRTTVSKLGGEVSLHALYAALVVLTGFAMLAFFCIQSWNERRLRREEEDGL